MLKQSPTSLKSLGTVLISLTLAGCAELSKAPPDLFEALQVQRQPACCMSLAEVLARPERASAEWFHLTAASPHFDFGRGIAPFAILDVGGEARVLEVEALLQQKGTLHGGDGLPKYVDLQPYFFDARGAALPARQIDKDERFTGMGTRALFTYVAVPQGATRLIVAADPTSAGRYTSTMIKNPTGERLTSKTKQFFGFAGFAGNAWYSQAYGYARVRPLSND
jgi:hypothetical protein